jgi:hypothetical protein
MANATNKGYNVIPCDDEKINWGKVKRIRMIGWW